MSAASAREAIRPDGPGPAHPDYSSPAIKVGDWVFTSGHPPTDDTGALHPDAVPNHRSPFTSHVVELQTRRILTNLARTLEAAGCDLRRDLSRIYWWLVSEHPSFDDFRRGSLWADFPDIAPIHHVRDGAIDDPQPATTGIGVREHLVANARLAVDAIAILPPKAASKETPSVPPEEGGDADGRASVVRSGDWVFATAVPTDWRGDFMVEKQMGEPSILAPEARSNPYFWMHGDIERQCDYTLAKLERILAGVGTSLERCFRAEVYIGHPSALYELDRSWKRWFPERPPARVVVPYCGLGGKGWQIEIGLQLLADDSPLTIEEVQTSAAPEPFLHEPQALRVGELLFLSTQLPVDATGGVPDRLLPLPARPFDRDTAALQAEYVAENVGGICEAAGSSLHNLCRRQAFYADFSAFASVTRVWKGCFADDPPASTDVRVATPDWPFLVPGAEFMFDLIGYCPAVGAGEDE